MVDAEEERSLFNDEHEHKQQQQLPPEVPDPNQDLMRPDSRPPVPGRQQRVLSPSRHMQYRQLQPDPLRVNDDSESEINLNDNASINPPILQPARFNPSINRTLTATTVRDESGMQSCFDMQPMYLRDSPITSHQAQPRAENENEYGIDEGIHQ